MCNRVRVFFCKSVQAVRASQNQKRSGKSSGAASDQLYSAHVTQDDRILTQVEVQPMPIMSRPASAPEAQSVSSMAV